ncbi:alpha/beta fold hydrolase [Nocardia brasiliensis]|uniref:alpha/beta fold hydrolase n=1 Tax=Nocardia brasiliensis TaxID=37326 RepID=UPI00367026EB
MRQSVSELDNDLVLVGHSGAGPQLPGIATVLGDRVRAMLYVDATLPHPGEPEVARMPQALVAQLRAMVTDGVLPPWHEWFPPQVLAEMLPDDQLRRCFVAEIPCVAFDYFTEPLSLDVWSGPAAYVVLSEAYQEQAARARDLGFAVLEHADHHLAMLTAPDAVVSTLLTARARCR